MSWISPNFLDPEVMLVDELDFPKLQLICMVDFWLVPFICTEDIKSCIWRVLLRFSWSCKSHRNQVHLSEKKMPLDAGSMLSRVFGAQLHVHCIHKTSSLYCFGIMWFSVFTWFFRWVCLMVLPLNNMMSNQLSVLTNQNNCLKLWYLPL